MSEKIDHSLSRGIVEKITDISCGETTTVAHSSDIVIPPEISYGQAQQFDFEFQKRHLVRAPNGTLEFVILNESVDNGDVLVINPQWGGSLEWPVDERELAVRAAVNPDQRLLMLNPPNFGLSASMPAAVSHYMAQTGDPTPYGEYTMAALDRTLRNFDNIDIMGASWGSFCAVGQANVYETRRLLLDEPMSFQRFGYMSLMRHFAMTEGAHQRKYLTVAAVVDPESAKIQTDADKLPSVLRRKFFPRPTVRNLADLALWGPMAMARGKMAEHLQATRVSQSIDVFLHGGSSLTDMEIAQNALAQVAAARPHNGVRLHEIENHGHFIAGMPAIMPRIIR